jgi:hypothetical protein
MKEASLSLPPKRRDARVWIAIQKKCGREAHVTLKSEHAMASCSDAARSQSTAARNHTRSMPRPHQMGQVFRMAMPMPGIGLDYCGRFVDHDLSSDDKYAVRLGCSNSHPLGAR